MRSRRRPRRRRKWPKSPRNVACRSRPASASRPSMSSRACSKPAPPRPADQLGRVGGILEAKKIAGMAEAHYAQIAPHLDCGPIVGAANIQLAGAARIFSSSRASSAGTAFMRKSSRSRSAGKTASSSRRRSLGSASSSTRRWRWPIHGRARTSIGAEIRAGLAAGLRDLLPCQRACRPP